MHHSNQEKREKADREFKNLKMSEEDKGKVQNFVIRFEKVTKKAENLMKKKYSEVDKVFQMREGLKIRGLEGLMTQLTADNIKTVDDMKVIISRFAQTVQKSSEWTVLKGISDNLPNDFFK